MLFVQSSPDQLIIIAYQKLRLLYKSLLTAEAAKKTTGGAPEMKRETTRRRRLGTCGRQAKQDLAARTIKCGLCSQPITMMMSRRSAVLEFSASAIYALPSLSSN